MKNNKPQKVLVLFDVDGTLLITGGATSRCIRRAVQQVLGGRAGEGQIIPGTLDPQIFLSLAAEAEIADASGQLEAYKQLYLSELRAELQRCRADMKVMPGARELLRALRDHPSVVLGLLSGNYRDAVEMKFETAGLNITKFTVCAFAEDGRERADLVEAALGRYAEGSGERLEPRHVILVGDTPQDIACARQAGCRVVAVATGFYSEEQLRRENPDRLVASLMHPEPLYDLIEIVSEQ